MHSYIKIRKLEKQPVIVLVDQRELSFPSQLQISIILNPFLRHRNQALRKPEYPILMPRAFAVGYDLRIILSRFEPQILK